MNEQSTVVIDGAYGEGGGQIVRSSLALAAISGRPLRLLNIRGGRKKQGLSPQHLTAVQACASLCSAEVTGAEPRSRELSFIPKAIRAGTYECNIGTAGAATLVMQTILPPLLQAGRESNLLVHGGTHVPWSPTYHYFAQVFIPTIELLGFRVESAIVRWGWYPKGGGEIRAVTGTFGSAATKSLAQPFELEQITGLSASSRLPEHIRVRQKRQLQARLQHLGVKTEIALMDVSAPDPGSLLFVCAHGKHSLAGFSSLGVRGKPAERVADEAADALIRFLKSKSALDSHLADQILIYLAMVPGKHTLSTSVITEHLLTNAWVIEQFLAVQFEVSGGLGKPGLVIKRDR